MAGSQEIARGFFVAGRDSSELFDKLEEALDQIALGVEGEVAVALDFSVGLWRDDRLDSANVEARDEAVGVVALVGEKGFGRDFSGQGSAWVMSWTWPPVRRSASGLPRASTITWILVVGPPRDRPMAWS